MFFIYRLFFFTFMNLDESSLLYIFHSSLHFQVVCALLWEHVFCVFVLFGVWVDLEFKIKASHKFDHFIMCIFAIAQHTHIKTAANVSAA